MPTLRTMNASPTLKKFESVRRVAFVVRVLVATALRLVWLRVRGRPIVGHIVLRDVLERLAGSFVKFGQILSLQIDSLPRVYCDTLLSLLDRVAPVPPEELDRVLSEELGAGPQRLFASFSVKPLASASIGQVHRAALPDGTEVAVKIQRPGIRQKFEIDNKILSLGVWLIVVLRLRRFYFMRDPVKELQKWTADETDYRREAVNCQRLADNAVGSGTERVPKVFWRLTTSRILTLEFLPGPSVATYLRMIEQNDAAGIQALRDEGLVPSIFSTNVISNFLSDAFRHGAFHADLHPANLLILPGNVVGYVDFGIVATLTAEARRKQIELTLAYSSGDPRAIYEGFINICKVGANSDLTGLRKRIEELTATWYEEYSPGGRVRFRVSVTRTMMDLLTLCQDYHVLVDREMIKYIRATILADGLVSRLAPEVDLARILRTVVEEYIAGEARDRVLSTRGGLALMTDAFLWASAGPAPLLQALSLLERRTFPIQASVGQGGFGSGGGRTGRGWRSAAAAGLVWLVLVAGLAVSTDIPDWQSVSSVHIIFALIVILWSLWLSSLVRNALAREA